MYKNHNFGKYSPIFVKKCNEKWLSSKTENQYNFDNFNEKKNKSRLENHNTHFTRKFIKKMFEICQIFDLKLR